MSFDVSLSSKHLLSLVAAILLSACAGKGPDNEIKEIVFPKPPDPARYIYQQTILSDLDVVKESEDAKVQRWLTGVGRTGKPMVKPYGVVVKKGRVYVSDPPARVVRMFDFEANNYLEIGKKGTVEETLRKPFEMAVDDALNLYVVDRTNGYIKVYDKDGAYVKSIGNPDQYDMPTGVAVTPDGKTLFVSDTGGVSSSRHQILVYDVASGKLVRTFGSRGNGENQFNLPKGIAYIASSDELFVVDSANFRVTVYDASEGKQVRKFGQIGRKLGQFARPKSIAACGDEFVVVSDAAFGNVQLFNTQGQLLMHIGERGSTLGAATYMLTSGTACDEDKRIFVADQFFKKVDIFRPAELKEYEGWVKNPQAEVPAK